MPIAITNSDATKATATLVGKNITIDSLVVGTTTVTINVTAADCVTNFSYTILVTATA